MTRSSLPWLVVGAVVVAAVLAWLTLSPSFRLLDDDVADCFVETLETCFVRPVRR